MGRRMLVSEVERGGRVRGARGAQGAGRRVGAFGLAWVAMCEEVVLGMMTVSASWATALPVGYWCGYRIIYVYGRPRRR